MLLEEESDERVAMEASSSRSFEQSPDKVQMLSHHQVASTSTFMGKLWEFVKIQILGQENEFERYILETEASDCSLIAKYTKIIDLDLKSQPMLSIDKLTLNSIHIPHPLVSFMRNEANQSIDILVELQESPILVFIHGLGGQMSQFEPLMGLLSQCLEVLSLDLPGFGSSKLVFEENLKIVADISNGDKLRISSSVGKMNWKDFTTDNIVNIVYEFIMQNVPEDKKVVLIGHSMGTHLSVKLGKKLPKNKVEGLIFLSPPGLTDDVTNGVPAQQPKTITMLKVFTYLKWLFNSFRVWDRLEGLGSKSVLRQLVKIPGFKNNTYNKLRQLRWNLDINSKIVLNYANGFSKASYSELITAISQFNDDISDRTIYEKTLLLCGTNDQVTPVKYIHQINDFLTNSFGKKVSLVIEVNNAGHSILLAKPEFISGMILNHIELKFPERLHLSPAWVLKVKAQISGDKWGLKNELKWLQLQPISTNITRKNGTEISPLLGMKTLREGDLNHSPAIVEGLFYSANKIDSGLKGKLVAIVDISADIPPYSPKSFLSIKYYKCSTVSKVVPDQTAIRRFVQLIDDILADNKDVQDPLVAVHCHYGFNRTGFLICCYLIEKLGWSVLEAVEGFKQSKSPGIKHPHFIDALYVRYES